MLSRIIALGALGVAYMAYTRPPHVEIQTTDARERVASLERQHASDRCPPVYDRQWRVSTRRVGLRVAWMDGDYSPEIVLRYLNRRRRRLRHEYEKRLMVDLDLGGTVAVRFDLNEDGRAVNITSSAAMVGGSAAQKQLREAVESTVASVQFPKPLDTSAMQLVLTFCPCLPLNDLSNDCCH